MKSNTIAFDNETNKDETAIVAGMPVGTRSRLPRVPRAPTHANASPASIAAKNALKNAFWNLPPETPATQIPIHHKFDVGLHFNHKLNVTIRNINAVIKLIFKNTKEQSAITALSPGTQGGVYGYSSANSAPIDEDRVRAIQRIAATMKVGIPKRFESKTALREFIQTREFITAMKQSMNS